MRYDAGSGWESEWGKKNSTHLDYSGRPLTRETSSFTSFSSRPGRQKKSTNTCLFCCALREGCFKICRAFVNIATVKAAQEEARRVLNPQHAEYLGLLVSSQCHVSNRGRDLLADHFKFFKPLSQWLQENIANDFVTGHKIEDGGKGNSHG